MNTKMEILTDLENGKKNWEICQKYNIQSSTVSTISRKRLRDTDYDILDRIVYEWFNQRRANGELISGIILQSVAKNFHEKMAD